MTLSSVGSTVTERMSPSNIFSQVAPPSLVRYKPSWVTPTKTRSGVCLQPKMASTMPSENVRPTCSQSLLLVEHQMNNPCWVPAYKRTPSFMMTSLLFKSFQPFKPPLLFSPVRRRRVREGVTETVRFYPWQLGGPNGPRDYKNNSRLFAPDAPARSRRRRCDTPPG